MSRLQYSKMNPSSSSSLFSTSSESDDDDEPKSCKRPKNDVFINYSFEDIGKTFISHLKGALKLNSFAVSDHTMLPMGQDMHLGLLKAIEESEIYVLVFSPNYASSVRCLHELVDIMDSFHKFVQRKVLPVFFKVEPSHVRSQQGPFTEAFQAHQTKGGSFKGPGGAGAPSVFLFRSINLYVSRSKNLYILSWAPPDFYSIKKFCGFVTFGPPYKNVQDPPLHQTNLDPHTVQKWKRTLKDAGQLSGLTLQNGDEAKFVLEIVEELEKMQRPHELHVTDHPVGIGSRAEELISTLRLDWKDRVLVVVVFGISGIGKTTVVKEVYNRIAHNFDLHCFLAHIHDNCQAPNWKVELPKVFISCLTRENKFPIMSNHNEGVTKIRRLVRHQKVLLVLDDVDNFQQLESLGIYPRCFHEGSRIIITTRDKGSLGNIPYVSYRTRLLNRRESLNLFTRLMCVRDDHVNTKFIEEVVGCAGGLPLVLKVWSCHFKQYGREQWPSILETLKRIPHGDVQKQLKMSYDSLTNRSKRLFLDIACFFNNTKKDLVVKVLQDEDSGFFPEIEIQYLVDKSLVEILSKNQLQMHHVIREMGQEIVRQENEDEPGKRTRLSDERDVKRVLTECSGTESVESIIIKSFKNIQEVTVHAFKNMSNLRLIRFEDYVSLDFDEGTHLCFKKLRYMEWCYCPFKSLDNIDMGNVVVLRLEMSELETLWEGVKSLKKLRILDVSRSSSLTKTGNFFGLENLEALNFYGCENLKELHNSIGDLQKLLVLDLRESIPLKRIPWEMIGKLASLRKLLLSGESESDVVNDSLLYPLKDCPITKLTCAQCNISKISSGVVSLTWLKHLSLFRTKISGHLDSLLQLNTITLFQCNNIQSLPNLPGNITTIKVLNCVSLVSLPANMSELKSLTVVHFSYCAKLGSKDPHFLTKVTRLTNLTHLTMNHCGVFEVPSEIGNLVSLKELDLSENPFSSLPDSLGNLSQLVDLKIVVCPQLRLLPLLPSNLTNINAYSCYSLDLMSSASRLTIVSKESPFSNRFMIKLTWDEEVPEWCSYQVRGDVLSFVAPYNNICGIIFCANTLDSFSSDIVPKLYNETKNASHCFETYLEKMCLCVMSYPLDKTTLLVEPGDSVVLKLPQGSVSSCGLRLIYESDVVDCKFVLQTVAESIPSKMLDGTTQLNADGYSCSDDEDYSCSGYEDYSSSLDEYYSCPDNEDHFCSVDEDYSCSDDACGYLL